ncbi:MAG: DegT/DnrJ/EryC1/StrS family aminotransferase [Desulfobacterales bacterium]
MQFIDLSTQQKRIKEKIDRKIQDVLEHGQYIMGPELFDLERILAEFTGVKHALSCSSGTDALLMALMALDAGPGDAVFTTPFTFIATAEVISLLGATPVFVDIQSDTFNLAPEKLEQVINDVIRQKKLKPKAVIVVDLFGLPAQYDEIAAIARRYNLFVIEDAAQSFGAQYYGKKAGSFGDIACTSFFPAKPLGGYGDGGMCFTRDHELHQLMVSLRNHGQGEDRYENIRIGINGRLDTLQAAILLCKFEIFPQEMEMRQKVAERYSDLLSGSLLKTPVVPEGMVSAWAQYSVLSQDSAQRQRLQDKLRASNIPSVIYYPTPLHLQKAFSSLGYRIGDFPVSEECAEKIFSLPMHPYLKAEEQQRIADILITNLK